MAYYFSRIGLVLLLAWSALPAQTAPAPVVGAGAGGVLKNVTLRLLQCLDASCAETSALGLEESLRLEATLWDSARKQGLVVLREHYREPNLVDFKNIDRLNFHFDHVAFNPTRAMRNLYDVDRLTLWPIQADGNVRPGEKNEFVVRLPRRPDTLLLELSGIDAAKLLRTRVTEKVTKVYSEHDEAAGVVGELKAGQRVLVEDRFDLKDAAWLQIKTESESDSGPSGWIRAEGLRVPRITATREFLGIAIGFFGLFRSEGYHVRWNNKDYVAFPDLEPGRYYEIEFSAGGPLFKASGSAEMEAVSWSDAYKPLSLEVVNQAGGSE